MFIRPKLDPNGNRIVSPFVGNPERYGQVPPSAIDKSDGGNNSFFSQPNILQSTPARKVLENRKTIITSPTISTPYGLFSGKLNSLHKQKAQDWKEHQLKSTPSVVVSRNEIMTGENFGKEEKLFKGAGNTGGSAKRQHKASIKQPKRSSTF